MHRNTSVAICAILIGVMVGLLTGCGQKGPLRLPPPAPAASSSAE